MENPSRHGGRRPAAPRHIRTRMPGRTRTLFGYTCPPRRAPSSFRQRRISCRDDLDGRLTGAGRGAGRGAEPGTVHDSAPAAPAAPHRAAPAGRAKRHGAPQRSRCTSMVDKSPSRAQRGPQPVRIGGHDHPPPSVARSASGSTSGKKADMARRTRRTRRTCRSRRSRRSRGTRRGGVVLRGKIRNAGRSLSSPSVSLAAPPPAAGGNESGRAISPSVSLAAAPPAAADPATSARFHPPRVARPPAKLMGK